MGDISVRDVAYSTQQGCHICLHCGQPVLVLSTGIFHAGTACEPRRDDDDQDCAPEGYATIGVAA